MMFQKSGAAAEKACPMIPEDDIPQEKEPSKSPPFPMTVLREAELSSQFISYANIDGSRSKDNLGLKLTLMPLFGQILA